MVPLTDEPMPLSDTWRWCLRARRDDGRRERRAGSARSGGPGWSRLMLSEVVHTSEMLSTGWTSSSRWGTFGATAASTPAGSGSSSSRRRSNDAVVEAPVSTRVWSTSRIHRATRRVRSSSHASVRPRQVGVRFGNEGTWSCGSSGPTTGEGVEWKVALFCSDMTQCPARSSLSRPSGEGRRRGLGPTIVDGQPFRNETTTRNRVEALILAKWRTMERTSKGVTWISLLASGLQVSSIKRQASSVPRPSCTAGHDVSRP